MQLIKNKLGHKTVMATETFLLPDLKSGIICHRNRDMWISALDNSESCWSISLGFSQPRRIVTFWLLHLRSSLTYLLTYISSTCAHCKVTLLSYESDFIDLLFKHIRNKRLHSAVVNIFVATLLVKRNIKLHNVLQRHNTRMSFSSKYVEWQSK